MDLTLSRTEQRLRELGAVVFDLDRLLEGLGQLSDCRGERGRRYELAPLLLTRRARQALGRGLSFGYRRLDSRTGLDLEPRTETHLVEDASPQHLTSDSRLCPRARRA